MHGVCVPARTPHYQKFNAQILTLGVLTGFSLWPHAWGNHLVDHGIPYARLVWRAPISGSVISTNDYVLTFEKLFSKWNSTHRQSSWTICDNWITNYSIESQGGQENSRVFFLSFESKRLLSLEGKKEKLSSWSGVQRVSWILCYHSNVLVSLDIDYCGNLC